MSVDEFNSCPVCNNDVCGIEKQLLYYKKRTELLENFIEKLKNKSVEEIRDIVLDDWDVDLSKI